MKLLGPLVAMSLLLSACHDRASDPAPSPGSDAAAPPATRAAITEGPAAARDNLPAIPGLPMGQPVPASGGWVRDPQQASDGCAIYTAKALPHAYAIVIDGKAARVSFAPGAPFALPTGIGPGATEAAVRRAYPGVVSEPHKYQDAPAKYLTLPGAAPGQPGLRFEIGSDGTVEQLHIGLPGALELVEGCA